MVEKITWNDDTIDSRDLLAYMGSNEKLLKSRGDWETYEDFKTELESVGELESGLTAINDRHFEEHCRELTEELYPLGNLPYYIVEAIDWEYVAYAFRDDYVECSFGGNTYYIT